MRQSCPERERQAQLKRGGSSATWDARGNLTTEPQSGKTYGYSSENLLTSASGGVTLGYDPATRLYQVTGAATTRFAYDGLNAIADYDGSNALQHRYVFAPGIDQPIVQYDANGNRAFLGIDERGSIVSLTDSSGTLIGLNRYDEYGKPQSTNLGRFQYTGQMWLSEIGAQYSKARVYLPHLGIFAQSDPIGYAAGANQYGYVLNDPVNWSDPLGLVRTCITGPEIDSNGTVVPGSLGKSCGSELPAATFNMGPGAGGGGFGSGVFGVGGGFGGGGLGGLPIGADSPNPLQIPNIQVNQTCSLGQRAGQAVGNAIGEVGALGTNLGVGGIVAGAGITAVGIGVGATGNVPVGLGLGFLGVGIIDISAEVTAYSGLITVGGATISALSGAGKPAIVEGLTRLSTRFLPSGPIKDVASFAVSKGLNAVVPEVGSCTP